MPKLRQNWIKLINEVEIELRFEGEVFLGLGQVRRDGVILRDGTWPLHPQIATADGLHYTRMELLEVVRDGDAQVLRVKLVASAGGVHPRIDYYRPMVSTVLPESPVEDLLEWRLAPLRQEISGEVYEGFSYSYHFRSNQRKIHRLRDWGTWELGGKAEGNTLIYRTSFGTPEVQLTRASRYTSSEEFGPSPENITHTFMQLRHRFGTMQCFDYQWNPQGSLLLAWERPDYVCGLVHKEAGSNWVLIVDEHWFELTHEAQPPARWVLFRAADGEEDIYQGRTQWMRCWQWARAHYGNQVGLPPRRPYLACQVETYADPDKPETGIAILEDLRDRILPRAAELGYNAIYFGPRWECLGGNVCAPQEFRFAEKWGGEELMRDVCATGKRLGVKAVPWLCTHIGIRHAGGELSRQHPDWIVQDIYGGPYDARYGEVGALDLNGPAGDYWFERLCYHVEEIGVEAWFFDSYPNLGLMPVNFADPRRRPHMQRLLEFQAWCQERGVDWLIEGDGTPFGIPSSGVGDLHTDLDAEDTPFHGNTSAGYLGERAYVLTDANLHMQEAAIDEQYISRYDYFRSLAARGPIMFYASPFAPDLWKWVTEEVVRWNRIYAQVQGSMDVPTVLPEDLGLSWQSANGKVQTVWAFQAGELPVAEGGKVSELVTGEELTVGSVLRLEPWRVYRVCLAGA